MSLYSKFLIAAAMASISSAAFAGTGHIGSAQVSSYKTNNEFALDNCKQFSCDEVAKKAAITMADFNSSAFVEGHKVSSIQVNSMKVLGASPDDGLATVVKVQVGIEVNDGSPYGGADLTYIVTVKPDEGTITKIELGE